MRVTKPQRLIYDMEKFIGGSISVICGCFLMPGMYDVDTLKNAVNGLFRLNDALRMRIVDTGSEVSQYIEAYTPREIEVLHFGGKKELDDYCDNSARIPFELTGNLCELKIIYLPHQSGAILKLHHIISDAWTVAMIANQFFALVKGEEPKAYSYTEYLEAEDAYMRSKRFQKDREFHLEQFRQCDEVLYLAERQPQSYQADRSTFVIDREAARVIRSYGEKNKLSPFVLFTAALAVYFNRIKQNAERFFIGTAVLNRTNVREKNTMGMFINTVPMLMKLHNDASFAENLASVKAAAYSALMHQKFNYGDVLAELRREYGFTEKLYDVMVSYQNASLTGENCSTTWYHCGCQTESLQMHIDDRDNEGIFRIHYDYLTELFTEKQMERLHAHILQLLLSAIADETQRIREIPMLTESEKYTILCEFNDTATDYPKEKCVHQLFEEQVKSTPDRIAVIACDRTLTYAQLDEQSNRIANALIAKGIQKGDIVAFCLPRRSYLISTMFGILKSGACYMPIDPDNPKERIEFMLSDSSAAFVVTEDNIASLMAFEKSAPPSIVVPGNSPCYCIYTSGSTGKPKGTIITHRNVVNYCNKDTNHTVAYKLIKRAYQSIVSITTVSFDIFVTESILPLLNAFIVIFADEKQSQMQGELNLLLNKYHADVLQTTPTKMKALMANDAQSDYLKKLQVIILGGEVLEGSLVEKLNTITTASVYNIYGPSETTVWITNAEVENANDITIGKPMANTQIYILDKYMNPTPIGVTGELCIAGDCVGAGYLNRPELTAERFIDNPFGEGKLYRTGDLAYWREDGNIVYVGRNDFQVKIRGLRIELGEIENAIASVDGILQSAVVVRKNDEGRQLICAFYTGKEYEPKEIRDTIGEKLPQYMLPHIIVHLDAMPLTPSGKIDRKSLPAADLSVITAANEYIAPVTEREKLMAALLEKILEVRRVGLTNDFFDLGCDSLRAIEFVSACHYEGIYFNLQAVFDHRTIQSLLAYIDSAENKLPRYSGEEFSELHKLIENNRPDSIAEPKAVPVGNILLAGATGFLGAHILAEYLDHDEGQAFCIVRGHNTEESRSRLHETLRFYFGDKYAECGRIHVFCGDLTKEHFGLGDGDYQWLLSDTDTVINSVATVKHFGSYQFFYEMNVRTTQMMIAFSRAAGCRMIQISTTSVAGNDFDNGMSFTDAEEKRVFSESDLYIGQPLDNVYVRSKFEAEKAVLEAMTQGLQANIMRMGNLMSRRSDGRFQRNYESNAYLKRVKAMIELGCLPEELLGLETELTPVDDAAKAVMTIVRHFRTDRNVFHIENVHYLSFEKLLKTLAGIGMDVKAIGNDEFADILRQTETNPELKHIYETFVGDIGADGRLHYESNISISTSFTEKYLAHLGFVWHRIDEEYFRNYFDYFKKIGYIEN